MRKSDFFYDLPENLIAQTPIEPRNHSRLMKINKATGEIEHNHFYNLCKYLKKGDLLIFRITSYNVCYTKLLRNGTEVPTEIYKSIFLSMKNQADIGDNNYWNDKGDEFTDMKNNVEDFLKTFYVPVIFSKQYNISLSDADNKEIDDAIKSIIEQTGGEEAYEEALKTEFLTKEIYYELTKIKALDKRVFTDLYKEGGLFAVSDDVIKEAFKNDFV